MTITDPEIIKQILEEINTLPTPEAIKKNKEASELLKKVRNG